jgi:hypothetical protein
MVISLLSIHIAKMFTEFSIVDFQALRGVNKYNSESSSASTSCSPLILLQLLLHIVKCPIYGG